ncbi:hypothetical protein [Emticicia sp. 17c]|uniref:hypothetical protein n=1 Tax=Emticicia sp. 17c TaxID=3127704 RepID=UPI00301E3B71
MGQKLLKNGFQPEYFPLGDGDAYFAGPNSRHIAEEYAKAYGEGILEVRIPKEIYNKTFRIFERPMGSRPGTELVIPQTAFPLLNSQVRVLLPY